MRNTLTPAPMGKATLLYMGAQYCPYCAAERWAIVYALNQFGTFTHLAFFNSPAMDGFAPVPTYDFPRMTYQSAYVTFESCEAYDSDFNSLQHCSASASAAKKHFDPKGGVPFLLVNGTESSIGSYVKASLLAGHTAVWVQNQLRLHPATAISVAIIREGTYIAGVLCQRLANNPPSSCAHS